MELVYLWVEDYKNIKKQGFNFSPHFKCHYDEAINKLTIDENKEYVSIFPENINVTAIVGENGSGKSSLLYACDVSDSFIAKQPLYIYKKQGQYYSNYWDGKIIDNKKIIKNDKLFADDNLLFLDRNIVMNLDVFPNLFSILNPMHTKHIYAKAFDVKKGKYSFDVESFRKKIIELIFKGKNLENSFFNPKQMTIQFNIIHKEFIVKLQKLITRERIEYTNMYNIYIESCKIVEISNDKNQQTKLMEDFLEKRKYKKNCEQDCNLAYNLEIIDFESKFDNFFTNFTYRDTKIIENGKKFVFDTLRDLQILKKDGNYEIFFFLSRIGFLDYDFIDKNKYFSTLSTGEKNMFTDFILLNHALKDKPENKNIFLLLDEPDTTMHPQWQKSYINELIWFLSGFKGYYFHIIITSHSPFILSDLPKENVIFLDKYKENDIEVQSGIQKVGNCKQVYPFSDNQQTFGANIHTLLSHGFFMQDGLMGEFAKQKINEIIEFHNRTKADNMDKKALTSEYENKKTQFWHIQKIVGEDYLKQVIKNHLIEIEKILFGKDGAKNAEIKRLKAKIELLEK